jgi:hypothetical protein
VRIRLWLIEVNHGGKRCTQYAEKMHGRESTHCHQPET